MHTSSSSLFGTANWQIQSIMLAAVYAVLTSGANLLNLAKNINKFELNVYHLDANMTCKGLIEKPQAYTECHSRNGPNFGRVFLMLNYTDITQNTYVQS